MHKAVAVPTRAVRIGRGGVCGEEGVDVEDERRRDKVEDIEDNVGRALILLFSMNNSRIARGMARRVAPLLAKPSPSISIQQNAI